MPTKDAIQKNKTVTINDSKATLIKARRSNRHLKIEYIRAE